MEARISSHQLLPAEEAGLELYDQQGIPRGLFGHLWVEDTTKRALGANRHSGIRQNIGKTHKRRNALGPKPAASVKPDLLLAIC